MADHKDPERVDTGRLGGLTSWTNADARGERHQRMEAVLQSPPLPTLDGLRTSDSAPIPARGHPNRTAGREISHGSGMHFA